MNIKWLNNKKFEFFNTAIEKDAYESPTDLQVLVSPNGLPSSLQIAGTIMSSKFPKFPVFQKLQYMNINHTIH